jgi:hypothetical protein
MPPWSSRREVAGLMGTFLVFLLSYSWHSYLPINQLLHLFQTKPVMQSPAGPRHHPSARVHRFSPKLNPALTLHPITMAVPAEANSLPMNMFQRHWTYIFGGKATLHNQPCPNASILVRLTSGDETVTQGTITGPDGSYALQVAIGANEGDPVDWTLEAYTPDFKKVELSGRKIVQHLRAEELQKEQIPIIVNAPVEFLVSLSK